MILSNAIFNSQNIHTSDNVLHSSEIRGCENVTDCSFCADCKNIINCLFCYGLEDAEYYIFNKPVDKQRFGIIQRQYHNQFSNIELSFVKNNQWPQDMLIATTPIPYRFYDKHYVNFSDRFWKWVKSVPNYDALLLYKLTLKSDL